MKRKSLTTLAVLVLLCNVAWATVKLPAIFGDNMVLQRNIKVPVWGWADAGEQVQIQFMGGTFKTVTGNDGKWSLKLGAYKAGGPYEMTVKGSSNQLTYKNILMGDVWLVTGQSNMELGIQSEEHAADAIPKATDTQIHFFSVPMTKQLQPTNDIGNVPADSPNGKWLVCSPAVLGDPKLAWHGFSAIGYYFAQQVRQSTGVPMGMVATYKGGTPAQAWISEDGLQKAPAFDKYVARHQALVNAYQETKASYPQRLATYQDSLKAWNAEVGNAYALILKQWDADVKQAKANNQNPPVRSRPAKPAPRAPGEPDGGFGAPTNLFNSMIYPLVPYGIKGVIWYQGESNGDRLADAIEYKELFPRLITDWRNKWGQGNFPFLYVQLPNYRAPAVTPSEGNWPWVREAQLKTLALPFTGMPVITDVGDADNIHPTNKLDPGIRLALVARHLVYGEKVVYSGPVYKSMKVEGNKIIISFDQINKGLVAGRPPAPGTMTTMDIKVLKGFGIAGDDGKFVWANAEIEGNNIIVSSDQITNPVAVRYNWADNPPGNLYNRDGLPAGPFRTDSWPAPLLAVH